MRTKILKIMSIVMSATMFANSGNFVCAHDRITTSATQKKSKQGLISKCLIGAAVVAGLAYVFQDEIKDGISNIMGKNANADFPTLTPVDSPIPMPNSPTALRESTPDAPAHSSVPEPIRETEEEIKADLASKAASLKLHRRIDGTRLNNPREALCYLLGSQEAIDYADEHYPEWKDRLSRFPDNEWQNSAYENYALMSMAYSLRLARVNDYHAEDPSNNELLFEDEGVHNTRQFYWEEDKNELRRKIVIENKTAVQSIDDHYEDGQRLCALNAGDCYEPGGFLPGRGSVVEESYSMQTDDLKDLSHAFFRGSNINEVFGPQHKFYCTREMYAPLHYFDLSERCDELGRRNASLHTYATKGIFSNHVRFIRSPRTWGTPNDIANFSLDGSKIGKKEFSMLTVVGLEDRAIDLLFLEGPYRELWKDITMRQCRFILNTMVNRGVDIPVLAAFTAGAFGGDAKIVADCFKTLLIDEGYANYFTKVVFAIKCASNASYNIKTFSETFGVPIVG